MADRKIRVGIDEEYLLFYSPLFPNDNRCCIFFLETYLKILINWEKKEDIICGSIRRNNSFISKYFQVFFNYLLDQLFIELMQKIRKSLMYFLKIITGKDYNIMLTKNRNFENQSK